MADLNEDYERALEAWAADYPGTHEAWDEAAEAVTPRVGGFEYFIWQFVDQGEYPTIPGTPPLPGEYSLPFEDYDSATVEKIMKCVDSRGLLPVPLMVCLDKSWPFYYFQKRGGVVKLTVWTPRNVDYEQVWGEHWELLRAAVSAWQGMTEEEKNVYRADAECQERRISGYHLFCSRFLKGLID